MQQQNTTAPLRFITRNEVQELVGLKRTALLDRVKAGTFPQPVKLGGRTNRWPLPEVERWQLERIAERG